jgi:selenide, water dikinase
VDDPYTYGAIAAANAMSDVYAMGGEVILALNICGFPFSLPEDVTTQILLGGAEKVAEAGGVLVGGHTIDAPEPLYGLSVMGRVHPNRVLTKAGARPGDILLLTKPLGVGIITTAAKKDAADEKHLNAAIHSMSQLNAHACRVIQEVGVHACTDVTGFSILGHAHEIAEKSGVRIHFTLDALPFLEGAQRYADEGLFPGGAHKNRRTYRDATTFNPAIEKATQLLLFTPETSGGLLCALPPDDAAAVMQQFAEAGQQVWEIGHVEEGSGLQVD